ncbi:MAG: hypothetical protein EP338_10275 [Bacteroidetes bacterium]|nr:MAG: hypothetical protein EP338_10275 [Bacteroidota bacterium]
MKFKLDSPPFETEAKISYKKPLVLLGSCFSDELGNELQNAGFDCLSNPFGTIYHPNALCQLLMSCLGNETDWMIFEHEKRFYSWSCAHELNAISSEILHQKLTEQAAILKKYLQGASHLFITPGTAWGYLLEEKKLVANCHKVPPSKFSKELSKIDKLVQPWTHVIQLLKQMNPGLEIVFTISPVRHIRDGIIENNRSKGRLFELVGTLEKECQITYYPSYEILIDELRDYRFYTEDLVHPSKLAVSYIWQHWSEAFLDESSQSIAKEVGKLRKLDGHRIQSNDPEQIRSFELEKQEKIDAFLKIHPQVKW